MSTPDKVIETASQENKVSMEIFNNMKKKFLESLPDEEREAYQKFGEKFHSSFDVNNGTSVNLSEINMEESLAYVVQGLDSGLHPKFAGQDSLPCHDFLERNSLDFIVLTHCHLDHLGSLPLLSREHPDAPVLLSYPSSILARRMLSNSISVMRRQRSELNLPELPFYGRGDLSSLYDRMKPLAIRTPLTVEKEGHSLKVTFHHAGHVAGAAAAALGYPSVMICWARCSTRRRSSRPRMAWSWTRNMASWSSCASPVEAMIRRMRLRTSTVVIGSSLTRAATPSVI